MKRIVVCADGTWQKRKPSRDDDGETNVAKMHEAADAMRGPDQACKYVEGLGASGPWWRRLWAGVTGAGLRDDVLRCYRFIQEHYKPGDDVFLFGFSRGAYTARSTVGMIRKVGLLKSAAPADLQAAYRFYRNAVHPNDDEARAFRAANSRLQVAQARALAGGGVEPAPPRPGSLADDDRLVPVRFLGVWDTVGALGIPGLRTSRVNHSFRDRELSGTVRTARQALAIDECRTDFTPTLWKTKDTPTQSVEQLWFAGTHGDVGGGQSPAGLSDVAFDWMRRAAEEAGLRLAPAGLERIKPDPLARLHANAWWWRLLRPWGRRAIGEKRYKPQAVSPEAMLRLDDAASGYRPPNLLRFLGRAPRRRRGALRRGRRGTPA